MVIHSHIHHHSHEEAVSENSIKLLLASFFINILLSVVELVGGVIAGSVALIGDALHNTSDALSILIAVIAFKIGQHKATEKYTYGFKRAEIIGGFVNLVLLFVSGWYLLIEGVTRLIEPTFISGGVIIVVSVFALIVDALTAKISHQHAAHNTNMKMVFLHNFVDAMGSVGVIISGLCVVWWQIYRIDGVIAVMIACYMIVQSILSFPNIVSILMNGAPKDVNLSEIKNELLKIDGIDDVHHIHLWRIDEHECSLECHVISSKDGVLVLIKKILSDQFNIHHCTIQIEKKCEDFECQL